MLKFYTKVKQVSVFLLIAILFFSFPQTVIAADEEKGSINLSYPIEGVEFSLYKIASIDPQFQVTLADEYAVYNIDLESENIAFTLASYVQSDNIQPLATAVTDENCVASFNNIPRGFYLIIGSIKVVDNIKYTALPVTVSLPYYNNNSLVWDLEVKGKYETVPRDSSVEISAIKIWKNASGDKQQPKEVSISLTQNGKVYDTVTLNSANNWKYKWKELNENDQWTVIENNVPDGYEVNIQKDQNIFIVTNTYKDTPSTPNTPELPQTGQIWWPVYVLTVAGICFIFTGVVRRRKSV
ncbi:MAG: Cna B-type domain-containing protein [Acutalibacteraceae bacterium]|nr:Cna B-type domain-containing protein [Acutalibacteraceae bacterium]